MKIDYSDRYQKSIHDFLIKNNLTLATAESCTGGLLGDLITNIPGSSEYYKGGLIAYDNEIKIDILKIKRETMNIYGAVSSEVASEMAENIRDMMQVDIGIAITGIAGPGGGDSKKPVGLTYISLCSTDLPKTKEFIWHDNRRENKENSAVQALKILQKYLENRFKKE